MEFEELIRQPAEWMESNGPYSDIIMTSRVRLARNLRGRSFPGWAKKGERTEILEEIKPRVQALSALEDAFSQDLQNLSAIQKQVLVERHLISREIAAKGLGSASVMDRAQTVSIMINEEDHLRMQAICPGLQLKEAHRMIDRIDTELEKDLDYAFDPELGYLTACPTNLGTGMRASAMLHLPALVLAEQINRTVQAVNKIGLAVRGIYGEGTEAMANLFQVSNQTTLGDKESEILGRLNDVINKIIEQEHNARAKLHEEKPTFLKDQVWRAYAVLSNAYIISSKEALNLLSMVRLGIDMEFFSREHQRDVDQLLMNIQPAHLQLTAKKKLSAEARDTLRAEIIRDRLKSLS